MDKEKTLLKLGIQIDTLKAHINRLKKSKYNIHPLDVDMLKQKTYELYDLIFELENSESNNDEVVIEDVKIEAKEVVEPKVEKVKEEKPKVEKPVVQEKLEPIVETQEEVKEELTPEIEQEPEENIEFEVVDTSVASVPEPEKETIVEPIVEPAPKEEVKTEVVDDEKQEAAIKQTTYDLFSGSGDNAVAEKFHTKEETSIAEKMQKSHYTNIREAIGINEKFLFINELFNGDMGRYNKILDDINELTTKQGVDTYLFELKIQFQWADDSDAYNRLVELCERKFS